jgi:hypothetical protein
MEPFQVVEYLEVPSEHIHISKRWLVEIIKRGKDEEKKRLHEGICAKRTAQDKFNYKPWEAVAEAIGQESGLAMLQTCFPCTHQNETRVKINEQLAVEII